ncbi:MAG TPA: hypothetical protein VHB25_06375 [Gemmatimonadaceae bacterium]|nr:hypothetical protein [Gemmatimonadaceae bacterium]
MSQSTDRRPPAEALNGELTETRLREVARIIVDYRAAKIRRRMPPDGNWNIGCDAYQWEAFGIREAAKGRFREWLYVPGKDSEVELTFLIGGPTGVPIKFYRADTDGQPARTLRVSYPELRAKQTLLELGDPLPADTVLRLAIEVDAAGYVEKITLVQLNGAGEVLYDWPVPLEQPGVVSFDEALRAPEVRLDPPVVTLPEDDEANIRNPDEGRGA